MPLAKDNTSWANLTNSGYCCYNNKSLCMKFTLPQDSLSRIVRFFLYALVVFKVV